MHKHKTRLGLSGVMEKAMNDLKDLLVDAQFKAEVLQEKYIEMLAMALIRIVDATGEWKEDPCLNKQVIDVHSVIETTNYVDVFNYHMDMMGREDLVLFCLTSKTA